ncbi:MAG TPA: hypothetical protein VNJ70_13915 [Thermoanaerobaculia bacterium]|nr:hypothetical protein [Thermoanaerobaculia bacterium]
MKILKTMLLAAGCVAAACCLPLGQHKPSHEQIAFLNTLEERTALALGEQEKRLKGTLKSALRDERQALDRLNEATTARHAAEIQLAEANGAGQNMIGASATIDRGQTASSGMVANAARKVEAAEVRERSAQHGYTQVVQRRSAAEDAAKQNAERVRLLHAEVKALATEYAVRPSQELLDRLIEKRTELAAQSGVESYVTWRTVKMEARTTRSGERWHTSPSPGALLY